MAKSKKVVKKAKKETAKATGVAINQASFLKAIDKAGGAGLTFGALRDAFDTGLRGPCIKLANELVEAKKLVIHTHNGRSYVLTRGTKFEPSTKEREDRPARKSKKVKKVKAEKAGTDAKKAARKPSKAVVTKRANKNNSGAAAKAASDVL